MNRNICLLLIGLVTVVLGLIVPGCDELITEITIDTITLAGHPIANFSADKTHGCSSTDTIGFTDLSRGPRQIWIWKFGDGDIDTLWSDLDTIFHVYDSTGVFDVSLTILDTTVRDTGRDTEVKYKYITIGSTTAGFEINPDTVCPGEAVVIWPPKLQSIDTWTWDFGDGSDTVFNDSTPDSIVRTYDSIHDSAYTYWVTLTVDDDCGQMTDSLPVVVSNCPLVWFSDSVVDSCAPAKVFFWGNSNQAISSWHWIFGNDSTADNQDSSTVYTAGGIYICSLIATSTGGTSVAVDTIEIYDVTTAGFMAVSETSNCYLPTRQFLVEFVDTSLGEITNSIWYFGDGDTLHNNSNPVHAYTNPGIYTVKLVVEGFCGIDSVVKDSFIVLSNTLDTAIFSISPVSGDTTTDFTFTDLSDGVILNWSWNFGDDSTATGPTATHKYADTGHYPVNLLISNGCGTAAAVDTVVVTEGP